jgi:putative phosphotransacetylase
MDVGYMTRMVMDALQQETGTYRVPVGVSARHAHLSRADTETLFGKGHILTKKAELMGGQFAAVEQVTIVGLKLRAIENVRVLGPERGQTQVEISATDALRLGVQAPLRDSGDLQGSAALAVIGPAGAVYLNEGCIIAARHIHMSPKDALEAGVRDGQLVEARIENERGLTLDNVKVRVHESYTLEMHLDTDEANACGVKTGDAVTLVS